MFSQKKLSDKKHNKAGKQIAAWYDEQEEQSLEQVCLQSLELEQICSLSDINICLVHCIVSSLSLKYFRCFNFWQVLSISMQMFSLPPLPHYWLKSKLDAVPVTGLVLDLRFTTKTTESVPGPWLDVNGSWSHRHRTVLLYLSPYLGFIILFNFMHVTARALEH